MNAIGRWRGAVVCLFLACLTACGDDPLVAARVTAILEGTIRNGLTRAPLEGATVRILGARGANGNVEATTDADGHYRIVFSGSGRFTYVIESDGFARAVSTITFDPNDFAVEGTNGGYTVTQLLNQEVYPTVGTLRATVYGNQFRDLISDAPVTLTFFSSIDDPSLTLSATTDDAGQFEIAGLPAGTSFTVTVRATDRDGDGVLDTTGTSQSVTLEAGEVTETFIGPVGVYNGPGVLWTNLDNMRSWAVNPEFVFVFRSPMDTDPSATVVSLRERTQYQYVATDMAWDSEGTELTINPRQDLVPGREYEIWLTGWSRNAESISTNSYAFRVEGGIDTMPMVTNLTWLDDPTDVEFTQSTFLLGMDPIENVDTIRFYGRNTMRSSDWVRLQENGPNDGFPQNEIPVTVQYAQRQLLKSFPGGVDTFFGRGEALEIAAAVVLAGVEGPLSTPVQIRDGKCIDVTLTTGTDNTTTQYFDNTGGTEPKPVLIAVTAQAQEYFAEDSDAVITIENGPFSPDNFVLDVTGMTLERVNRSTFELTGEIPADRDAQLDRITVDLSMLSDPSGNPVCQTSLEAFTPGRRGYDGVPALVWDFEANAQGWTATGAFTRGSADGPAGAVSNMWATGLGAARADNMTSTLRSPRFPVPSSYNLYWYELRSLDSEDSISIVHTTEDADQPLTLSYQGAGSNGFSYYYVYNLVPNTIGQIEIQYEAGVPTGGAGTSTAVGYRLDDVRFTGLWYRDTFYEGEN